MTYDPRATKYIDQFYFDQEAADLAVYFFETYLTHEKGEYAGKPFLLQPWQKTIVSDIYGWKRKKDGSRRYREVFIFVPRKNGKTFTSAGFASYGLFADKEEGAEIYSAAADREQARILFDACKGMIERNKKLSELASIYRSSIVYEKRRSSYKVISADAHTKHGFNSHLILFDELHAQKDRELYDVLSTSVGARKQPLIITITTAGFDKKTICYERYDNAKKVTEGSLDDPYFYPVIYEASEADDWKDPKTWAKANPNLGVSISMEYLESECKKAQEIPAYENTFKRLHLNIWTEQETRYLPMDKWRTCADPSITIDYLKTLPAYGGLDLSATTDLTAFVLVFRDVVKDKFIAWPYFWVPEETVIRKTRKDKIPYELWVKEGLIRTTPGAAVDQTFVVHDINELRKIFNIVEIATDPWNAQRPVEDLKNAGANVFMFRQGFPSMTGPTKDLLTLLLVNKFSHSDNAVLTWQASNLAVELDPAGNVKPSKSRSKEKIDGIVALIMALSGASMKKGEQAESVYKDRGLIILD